MYTIPSWARPVLTRDHVVQCRAWASVNGSPFSAPLTVQTGGKVKVGPDFVRRTLDVSVLASISDPEVSAYTSEVLVEYGVISGLQEWWQPVGTFVVTASEETAEPGIVQLTGSDRGIRVMKARFERPVTTSGNTVAAIQSLVTGADSRITFTDHTGSTAGHAASLWERDRADAVRRLAESIGAVLYFHPDGSAHLWPQPTTEGAIPAWSIGRGRGGAKVSSARGQSQDGVYNAYVVVGEGVDGAAGVTAVARDIDPASPTRYGGPYGKVPRFLRTSLVRTQQQANIAAAAGLARSVGEAWTIDLSGLPNPALEVGDVLSVEVEPGVWHMHMLDGYELPLSPGVVSYSTRSTAAVVEGEE